MNIGFPGLILILVIALVIFGPKKLPEMGRSAGKTVREFKTSAQDLTHDTSDETNEDSKNKPKLNMRSDK